MGAENIQTVRILSNREQTSNQKFTTPAVRLFFPTRTGLDPFYKKIPTTLINKKVKNTVKQFSNR